MPRWIWAAVSRSAVIESSIRACRATEPISRVRTSGSRSSSPHSLASAMPQMTATGPRISWAVVAMARRSSPTSSVAESRKTSTDQPVRRIVARTVPPSSSTSKEASASRRW